MTTLRLLGSESGNKTCPCLYEADQDILVVQGRGERGSDTVDVPHMLLDWAEPGMRIAVGATEVPGRVLVKGTPASEEIMKQLFLDDDETAVEVPRCV